MARRVAQLYDVMGSADAAPTRQAREVFDYLSARVEAQLGRLREISEGDVAEFNRLIHDAGVPAVGASAQVRAMQEAPARARGRQ